MASLRKRRPAKRRRANFARKAGALPRESMLKALTIGAQLPFPDSLRCQLTYTEIGTTLINAAAIGRYQYRGNDLFDPNFTGTGSQPQYFDQMAALYNRFRVYGSSIMVEFITTGADSKPFQVGLLPTAQSIAALSSDAMMALPRGVTKSYQVNRQNVIMRYHSSTSEILGVKDVEGADRLQALISATPAEVWLWGIWGVTTDGTNSTMLFNVKIVYDVEFFDRQIQSLSARDKDLVVVEDSKEAPPSSRTPTLRIGQKNNRA